MIKRWWKRFILRQARKYIPTECFSIMFVEPNYYHMLKGNPNFCGVNTYPPFRDILEGEVGSMRGIRILLSNKEGKI